MTSFVEWPSSCCMLGGKENRGRDRIHHVRRTRPTSVRSHHPRQTAAVGNEGTLGGHPAGKNMTPTQFRDLASFSHFVEV